MLHIAKNEKAFLDSLFVPAPHGGTYDGYVTKRTKNTVSFIAPAFGEYLINKHGVLCAVRTMPDGSKWYSYANTKITDALGSYADEVEFCRVLKQGE